MSGHKVVASIPLENGLTLELLDASRLLAGDRWLVHLVARMEIPLTPDLLDEVPDGDQLCAVLRQESGDRLGRISRSIMWMKRITSASWASFRTSSAGRKCRTCPIRTLPDALPSPG